MLLLSHDDVGDFGEFDPSSGHDVEPRHISGHFARLGDVLAVFYRNNDRLWIRLGDCVRELDSGRSSFHWERTGPQTRRITLSDGGDEIVSVEYADRSGGIPLELDPTPFVEEEHFDFGLFVRNVLGDEGRRKRIYLPESLS